MEGDDEQLARQVVEAVLGVPVTRFDDGTLNSQVDALIHYPDRQAALEVVADHDQAFNAQQDALHDSNDRIEVPGLRDSWTALVSRNAKINRVKEALPALLLGLQANPIPRRSRLGYRTFDLVRLGITSAWPMTSSVPGRVYLVPQAWGGFAGAEHIVGEWVTRVLDEQADVPAKLADHPDVAERHAFIWATPTSDMGVQMQLEPDEDHPFPVTPPALPSGVTHVWIGGRMWRQGVLAWFSDRGWWRTPWTWPSEGPITVGDQDDDD
jgi:hypothetical protein